MPGAEGGDRPEDLTPGGRCSRRTPSGPRAPLQLSEPLGPRAPVPLKMGDPGLLSETGVKNLATTYSRTAAGLHYHRRLRA